jgi:hypothetical protein
VRRITASVRGPDARAASTGTNPPLIASRFARKASRLPLCEIVLGAAILVGGVWLYGQSHRLNFWGDDWEFVFGRLGISPHTLFFPVNGALDLTEVVIYKVLLRLFGLTSYAPFRATMILLHLSCVVLLFLLARRRVGGFVGLAMAIVLLFLGSAGEILLFPGAMNHLCALTAGVGMLLALDFRTRLADVAACLLLSVSLSSGGEGLAFAACALILVLWDREYRTRWWIAVLPIALIVVWSLTYGQQGGDRLLLSNFKLVPEYVADQNANTAAGLVGLNASWGPVIAAVIGLSLGRRIAALKRISPQLAAMILGWLVYWLVIAFARANLGTTGTERYIYGGCIFVMLIAIEVFRNRRVATRFALATVVAAAFVIVANTQLLSGPRDVFATASDVVRADLAAVELAGARIPASYALPVPAAGMTAGQYLFVKRKWGSPAFPVQALPSLAEGLRLSVDALLTIGIGLSPPISRPFAGPPPRPLASAGGSLHPLGSSCEALAASPKHEASLEVTLPIQRVEISAGHGPVLSVQVRRFADAYGSSLGSVPARSSATLATPRDSSPQQWRARFVTAGQMTVCSLP